MATLVEGEVFAVLLASEYEAVLAGLGEIEELTESISDVAVQRVVREERVRRSSASLDADLADLHVLRCNQCGPRRRLVALITERSVIVRILAHLGLETDLPPIQRARTPPQLELGF